MGGGSASLKLGPRLRAATRLGATEGSISVALRGWPIGCQVTTPVASDEIRPLDRKMNPDPSRVWRPDSTISSVAVTPACKDRMMSRGRSRESRNGDGHAKTLSAFAIPATFFSDSTESDRTYSDAAAVIEGSIELNVICSFSVSCCVWGAQPVCGAGNRPE